MRIQALLLAGSLAGSLMATACDLDVGDLNNPDLGSLVDNPTPSTLEAACTGLLIGARGVANGSIAQANGYVAQLGILGREAYNFDTADPRFIGEMLEGELQAGSPFGGNFWAAPYATLRDASIVLQAVEKLTEYDGAQKAGVRGFAKTMRAYNLLIVINTRDTNGAIIDTDNEPGDLAPIVDKDAVFAHIIDQLDEGASDLGMAGDEFTFALSSGFAGFDTPAEFLKFNRALRARVAVYQEDYATALTALEDSFVVVDDDGAVDLELGVYHVFGTASGDTSNNLTNPNIYAHPSLDDDGVVELKADDEPDDRLTRKVGLAEQPGMVGMLQSDIAFLIYAAPTSPVPIIRNEELVLLRAEANWFEGNKDEAADDLNAVRVGSGGLAPRDDIADLSDDDFVAELLYNRRYSLLFEGGHRWLDLRRFGLLEGNDELLDQPGHIINLRYPIPQAECNARPGENRCDLGST